MIGATSHGISYHLRDMKMGTRFNVVWREINTCNMSLDR